MKQGGFNFCKWHSNSKELMKLINDSEAKTLYNSTNNSKLESENKATFSEDDQSYARTELGSTTSDDETKVSGVNWDPESDQFYFDFSKIHEYGNNQMICVEIVGQIIRSDWYFESLCHSIQNSISATLLGKG